MISRLLLIPLFAALTASCQQRSSYDLAITDVNVFDTEAKQILSKRTIVINADTIAGILGSANGIRAKTILDGKERLACPGFIDTHMHLSDLFGGYEHAKEFLNMDSIEDYQNKLAQAYLNHGVTTLRDAGHTEDWLDVSLVLQQNPEPHFPNILISGAALISNEEREPYRGHAELMDAEDAQRKVNEYHELGIRQIKLYWRLREPEMKSVIKASENLGMLVYGHFDNNVVRIPQALDLGVIHFEHALTLFKSVFDFQWYWNDFQENYYRNFPELSFGPLTLEIFRYVDSIPALNTELNELMDRMGTKEATLSTSLHIFGSYVDHAVYETEVPVDLARGMGFEAMNEQQKKRLIEDFELLMRYCKSVSDAGTLLCIGTDCPDGGKAMISELVLLYEAGYSMEEVLQIATINGAIAIGLEDQLGSIEVAKSADIVLFEKDPFEDYRNLLSGKTIIKDGRRFN
jgi:hypothetical protein